MPMLSAACLEIDPRGLSLLRRCLATDAAYRERTARPPVASRPAPPRRAAISSRPPFVVALLPWIHGADRRT